MMAMALYFLLFDPDTFHEQLKPPLAAAWQQRSFAPCRTLCQELLPAATTYAARTGLNSADFLLCKISQGLAFDRARWRTLVGEALLFAAAEIPDIETDPASLAWLLAGVRLEESRLPEQRSPIEKVHFGSRELIFGGAFYRPEHAGYNDLADVARLADYLGSIDPAHWRPADLGALQEWQDAAEREDELEYLRERFRELHALYRAAHKHGWMIVCEQM